MVASQSRAVILGASMSGLLAARALSSHFTRVTIVERDILPAGADLRKGVPQAAHAHGLLASGYRVIDGFFPGLMDELAELGAPRGDVVGTFLWFQYGRWKLRHDSGLRGITVSRPCLEQAVRRRVAALPNVEFADGTAGVKPRFDAASGSVTGLIVQGEHHAETAIDADLVVDATGRGSRSSTWLEEWGFGQPVTQTVKVDVGYATRVFERRSGDLFDSFGAVVSGTPPAQGRLAAVLAAEGSRWVITLAGMLGDHPPSDEDGWRQFAASLPVPVVHDLVRSARPLSPIVTYRFPANQRRVYERMARFPEGYLVIGDAICSFNPIYGQGMTVAALQALALRDQLRSETTPRTRSVLRALARVIDAPWELAIGADLSVPEVHGPRPARRRLANGYVRRLQARAAADPELSLAFVRVTGLIDPPEALLRPTIALRVLRPRISAAERTAARGAKDRTTP